MSRLGILRHPVVLFGVVVVSIFWSGVFLQLREDTRETERVAIERGEAAAQLFEKDTVRLLKGVDAVLLMLRHAYYADRDHFHMEGFAEEARILSDVALNFGIVNRDGYLVKRTSPLIGPPIYLGDRDHFLAQKSAVTDKLYVGKTVVLRVSGEPSLQVSRPLREADGSFAGILVASIDPSFARQFSQALKLGNDSNLSIWGLDGQLRASHGFKTPPI